MKLASCLLFSLLLVPAAQAAEPRIVETESGIIVEINGNEEDRQAAQKQVEERIKAAARELEAQKRREESSRRRAEAKKDAERE